MPEKTAAQAPESFFSKFWREIVRPYGEAILFAILITTFVFTLVGVEGNSMLPSLRSGERMFIPKYEIWLHRMGIGSFQRGDVVVFKPPVGSPNANASFFGLWDYQPFFVKRIVGLPGDRVRIEAGNVFVNDHPLDQSFTTDYWQQQGCWDTGSDLANSVRPSFDAEPVREITVPAGEYFVMGDNRSEGGSEDSRLIGTIPLNRIAGRAVAIVWPVVRKQDASGGCQGAPTLSGETQLNWRLLQRPAGFQAIPNP
ncbi:signal peptidase I [Deinobacterium chartae]|uniref:Signal peptidase I n=1 Tax=Deinobacterium chartae TaxID=521158 RepID=A0A841I257_9DEIO|nr:signal peptidase I [Deinobacterium chartae]MBB6099146.1 signal peptidase I [Deinobacterium chartae]